jgi:hypothetical protein
MAKPITTTEWLDELARLSARSDEGLTAAEWSEAMGVGTRTVLMRLQLAQKSGWLRVGKRTGTSLDGRVKVSPVYQIVRPMKAKETK